MAGKLKSYEAGKASDAVRAITSGLSASRATGTTVWISAGRKITVTPPLFPGYAFVLIVSGWWNARWAAGVRRLVMDGLQ